MMGNVIFFHNKDFLIEAELLGLELGVENDI